MKESFLHIYHASSALKYAIDNICVCFRQTNTVDVWEISILYFIDYFIVSFVVWVILAMTYFNIYMFSKAQCVLFCFEDAIKQH